MQKMQLQAYSGMISSELHPTLAVSFIYRMVLRQQTLCLPFLDQFYLPLHLEYVLFKFCPSFLTIM